MVKVTVIYGHPTDAEAFERYYAETHIPLAMKIPNVSHFELAKALASPGQEQPAFYRIAEFWFETMEQCQAALASPEGQVAAQDTANFATGGATLTIAEVTSGR